MLQLLDDRLPDLHSTVLVLQEAHLVISSAGILVGQPLFGLLLSICWMPTPIFNAIHYSCF